MKNLFKIWGNNISRTKTMSKPGNPPLGNINKYFKNAMLVLILIFAIEYADGQTTTKICGNATYTYTPSPYNTNYATNQSAPNCLPPGFTASSMWQNVTNLINPSVGNFTISFATPVTTFDFFAGSFDYGNGETFSLVSVNSGIGSMAVAPGGNSCIINVGTNSVGADSGQFGRAGIVRITSTQPFTQATILASSTHSSGMYVPISCVQQGGSLNCNADTVAPILSANTATNNCPLTLTDLTTITASNTPTGTSLTWHSATPASNANKITGTGVGPGTYYAAFYDAFNDCYSGTINGLATSPVVVSMNSCGSSGCNTGSTAPNITWSFPFPFSNAIANFCPSNIVSFDSLYATNLPNGTVLSWHTATPASNANKINGSAVSASANGTPYYAAFYDSVNNCYSGSGSATTLVTAYQQVCCNAGNNPPWFTGGNWITVPCPANSFDLSTLTLGSMQPPGTILTFHTSSMAADTNELASNIVTNSGTYYAAFKDTANNCYSTSTGAINLTIYNCAPAPTCSNMSPVIDHQSSLITSSVRLNGPAGICGNPSGFGLGNVSNGNGEGTITFPQKTNYIDIKFDVMNGGGGQQEFFEIWTNGAFLDLSTCSAANIYDLGNYCSPSQPSTSAITTASNMSYANKAGVIVANGFQGKGHLILDFGPNSCGIDSITIKNVVVSVNNPSGTAFHVSYCTTPANSPSCVGCSGPSCTAGSSAPNLTNTALSNVCPTSTADLTSIITSNLPASAMLTWHTATPATNANKISGTSVTAGTYYAAFHDSVNSCYSGFGDSTTAVTVTINNCCAAGGTAPSLSSSTLSNTCPATTADLTSITASNLPSGLSLTWHTATPATNANKVTGTSVAAGTYYAAFYDATNDCYSGTSGSATSAVTVTQTPCCNAGTVAPSVN